MSLEARRALQRRPVGLLVALAVVASCGRPPPIAPIGLVIVRAADLAPTLEEAGLDGRRLGEAAREGLTDAGLQVDEGTRRSYRATVDVVAVSVVPSGGRGPAMAEVLIELQVEPGWAAGAPVKRSGRASALLASGDRVAGWRSAFKGAIREAARSVALDIQAQRRGTETLTAELTDADPGVRERALRSLAARRATASAKAVAGCVHDPDPGVARAAIDALVAFRDPATALSLIGAAQAGDAATTLRLIPVLQDLGGADVVGYLLTLEAGHADPAVREAAAQALAKSLRPAPPRRAAKPARSTGPSRTD